MASLKLTVERIRNFTCPPNKKVAFLWDTGVTDLGVRATKTSKVFIFQDKLDGKAIRIKIGDIDAWPIESNDPDRPGARQEASRLKSLFDQGIDPRDEKAKLEAQRAAEEAEAARRNVTVEEDWNVYLRERKPAWSERHYDDHIKLSHPGG